MLVAFGALSSSRGTNGLGGVSGIRPTDMVAWLDLRGILDADKRRDFALLIEAMDAEFLRFAQAQVSHGENNRTTARDRRAPNATGRGAGRSRT